MTPEQIRWLTWGACETRRTIHGAATWDEPGTHALIERHCGTWTFELATEHVLAHARDPKARTPGAIVGPMPSTTPQRTLRQPPRDGEECGVHIGEYADHCRICNAPRAVDEDARVTATKPTRPAGGPTDEYRRAREAMRT